MIRPRNLFLAALVCLSTEGAQATSIAIVRPSGRAPAIAEALHRLQGELFALGLQVKLLGRATERRENALDSRADLERTAAQDEVDAFIDVLGETKPEAVEIWIFEPSSRRFQVSRAVLEPNAPNAAETLAIRAIEVLRSNFVEIDLAARARSVAPAPPPARDVLPRQPSRSRRRFGLEAGVAILGSVDGIDPALLPLIGFEWAASSWLAVELTLAGLGTRPTIETTLGEATVSQSYGLLGLRYSPLEATVRPILSLSAGAVRTSLEGRADSPEQGHSVAQWSFLVAAGVGAQFRFSDRYYVTPALHAQLAEPYVAVHFVDEEVARSGRPNLVASLAFGARL